METITKEKLLTSFVEVKTIYLHARRWFQRSYGNTYHTCEIWVNDRMVHKIGFTYGYGDQWQYNAGKWLYENGYSKGTGLLAKLQVFTKTGNRNEYCQSVSRYCRESGIEYNHTVTDVNRKKDL